MTDKPDIDPRVRPGDLGPGHPVTVAVYGGTAGLTIRGLFHERIEPHEHRGIFIEAGESVVLRFSGDAKVLEIRFENEGVPDGN